MMRSIVSTLSCVVVGFSFFAATANAELLGSNVTGNDLLVIDPATGLATIDDGFISSFGDLTALEARANGQLVGAVPGALVPTTSAQLIEIDRISNSETVLCNVAGLSVGALEEVDGVLYGVRNTGNEVLPNFTWELITIGDPVGGDCPVTLIGDTSFDSPLFEFEGLAWAGSGQFKGCASVQLILQGGGPEGGITTRHCTITLPDAFCENYISGLPGECGALTYDDAGRLLAARDGDLVEVNPTTGAETPIGNTSPDPLERIEGLTLRAEPVLSVGDFIGTTGNSLFLIDPATATPAFQAAIGSFGNITETEEMPRDAGEDLMLIGSVPFQGLVAIDPQSGDESLLCTLNPNGALNALEYIDGVLYASYVPDIDTFSQLAIVGEPDGGVCNLTLIGGASRMTGFGALGGLAYDKATDILLGCTANPLGPGPAGDIVECDRATGECTSLGPTGYASCSSLEIGPDGTVYAGTGGGGLDSGRLLRIDGTGVGPADTGAGGIAFVVTEIGDVTGGPSLSSILFVTPGTVQTGDLIGVTRDGTTGAYIDINVATGAGSLRQSIVGQRNDIEFNDRGFFLASANNRLITVDPNAGEGSECMLPEINLTGMEYVGDVLYAVRSLSGGGGSFLTIVGGPDPFGNCSLTDIGNTGFTAVGGLAYDGLTDTLYGCTARVVAPDSGQLVTCDRATGACTAVGPTGFSACSALEFGPDGILYGGTGGSLNVTDAGQLITIDPMTGAGSAIGPTGFIDGDSGNSATLSGLSFVPPEPPFDGQFLASVGLMSGLGGSGVLADFPAPGVPATVRAPTLPRLAEIEMRDDGTLFGVTGGLNIIGNIYTVSPVTGAVSLYCTHAGDRLPALEFIGDALYGVHVPVLDGPANLVIVGDPDPSGECPLTVIGPTGTGAMGGLATLTAFAEGDPSITLFGCTSDTLDDPPGDSGVLYTCDIDTGACTAIGPTGVTSCSALEDDLGFNLFIGGQDGDLYGILDPFNDPTAEAVAPGLARPLSGLAFIEDQDGDGTIDSLDNCPNFPNAAPLDCDTDGDGFGNRCDGDLNNSGFTGFDDLFLFGQAFQAQVMGTYTPDADFDCSGFVNFQDLQIFGSDLFGNPPGVVDTVATDKGSVSDAGFGKK